MRAMLLTLARVSPARRSSPIAALLSTILALGLPGCSIVLDLDSLQGGGADASTDAGHSPDAQLVDSGRDAAPLDSGEIDASEPTDAAADAGEVDGSEPDLDAGAIDAGPSVEVGGTVVGLPAGMSITLGNGGDTTDVTGAIGARSFAFGVAPGSAYDVEVVTAPSELLCVVYRGGGTATSDVSDVFVGCSTAAGLYAYFPFDGDHHAARGRDWDVATGALGYRTDRIGRADHALAPIGVGPRYRLDQTLDGRGDGSVPPGSAQFTVSAWVLVPASAPASSSEDVLGHFSDTAAGPVMQLAWRSGAPYFQLYFYWDGGFSGADIPTTTALDPDRWHHVAISAMGPAAPSGTPAFERSIYVDGVREGTSSTCCGFGNFTRFWQLVGGTNGRLPLDDLRIYARQLSAAEIAGIYAAENAP